MLKRYNFKCENPVVIVFLRVIYYFLNVNFQSNGHSKAHIITIIMILGVTDINNQECFKDYPDVVSIEEVQTMLRIGRNAVYELLRSGVIKSLKVGKKYIIPKVSIIKYVTSVA